MLSSSSVQTGQSPRGQKSEQEVFMKPKIQGRRKPKLVDVSTQVKYRIAKKPIPERKIEAVQTRNVEQFEIDFDDDENSSKSEKTNQNVLKERKIEEGPSKNLLVETKENKNPDQNHL